MTRQSLKEAFLWGFILWLIGFLLGIIFFAFVPQSVLGWVIMPFGLILTLWVLFKKIQLNTLAYTAWIAVVWTLIAIVCDYFFLVLLFKPADGYYKLDVYVYYALMLTLPLITYRIKNFH